MNEHDHRHLRTVLEDSLWHNCSLPQNRITEQALSDLHQEILAYICFISSQHPESSSWWLTGRGCILRDALCVCSKNGSKGALRMVMSQYVSLRLPWRPGGPVWSSGWPSQMGVPVCVDTAGFKTLALFTWWESRFQFYPEWTTRNANPASHMVYLYFSSRHMAYFPQTLQVLNSPLGACWSYQLLVLPTRI